MTPATGTLVILLSTILSINFAHSNIVSWEVCGGRLERALDTIHRESKKRNRLEEEESNTFYHRELRSAPLEISVSKIAVKLPNRVRNTGNPWARVDKCIYEPSNNSLKTRVTFNDLSVSGVISLMPRDQPLLPVESCRMTLRLRRAGVDFSTIPIARGPGQMRIRTESNFLEPRYASIYAYGCHSTRLDKQVKRQDKWPPFYPPRDEYTVPSPTQNDEYEAAEPRQLVGISKEVDVAIPNETRQPRFLTSPLSKIGIWRKNIWLTKSPSREKRALVKFSNIQNSARIRFYTDSLTASQEINNCSVGCTKSKEAITSNDFSNVLSNEGSKVNGTGNFTRQTSQKDLKNTTNIHFQKLNNNELKANFKREDTYEVTIDNPQKETKHLYIDETLDSIIPIDLENDGRNWQLKEDLAREMEDVFLRGASQALTRYIERQLHPAIKETLMLSMGYTISYG